MKIRTDFVTNSSSSSFILARKGDLNEEQKKAIIDYVESTFLGGDEIRTIEELDDYAKKNWLDEEDDDYQKMKRAIEKGEVVTRDWVSFEEADWDIARFYERIWDLLEKHGNGNFEVLDGDLSY